VRGWEKKRIAFVHNRLLRYRLPLFRRLARVHDVTFIITNEDKATVSRVAKKYKLNMVRLGNIKVGEGYYNLTMGVTKAVAKAKPDVVIAADPSLPSSQLAYQAANLRHVPFILWWGEWEAQNSTVRRFGEPAIKKVVNGSHRLIAYGSRSRDFMLSYGVDEKKVFIAPNSSFSKPLPDVLMVDLKKKFGLGGRRVVLAVGRLLKVKGYPLLLDAWSRVIQKDPNLVLVIVGDGPERGSIERIIEGLNIEDHVRMMGAVPNQRLGPYYKAAEMLVMPSTRTGENTEAWGLVLNEAMVHSLPVVATDAVGAAHDLIRNGENGFMVPDNDSRALERAILEIVDNPRKVAKMGATSRSVITQGYTYERMAEGFFRAVQSLG